jgi:[acyl-carrier-protein] S-malonyltransferase
VSLALLFSPQGSQAIGMGRELARTSAAARAVFEEADAVLGWSVSDLCWNGPRERLDDTRQTQPGLLTTSVAALRALEAAAPVQPAMVAGHSVGEYAALVAAGALELPAALRLTVRRGALMAEAAGDGAMSAILGLERSAVDEIVTAVARPTELVVANDNAPGQVVISGRTDAVEAAEEMARVAGARRCLRLPVSGAFHSPLMAGVADRLAEAFDAEVWQDAGVPVVSNVTAEPITDASRIRALLAEQVRSPVEWVAVVERMAAGGIDTMIECGPGSALVGMVRRIAPGMRTATAGDPDTLAEAVQLVRSGAGARVS